MTVLSLKQVGVFFAPGGEFHQELREAALDGILSAALRSVQIITTQEVQKASPVPIDRGVYRAGWRAEKITNGAAILNTVPWAVFIEFGVKGSSVKIGRRAIQQVSEWAHRRLGLSDAEAKHAAFAILNAAKKRGIFRNGSGLRILETYTKQRLPAILKAEVERQIAKVQK